MEWKKIIIPSGLTTLLVAGILLISRDDRNTYDERRFMSKNTKVRGREFAEEGKVLRTGFNNDYSAKIRGKINTRVNDFVPESAPMNAASVLDYVVDRCLNNEHSRFVKIKGQNVNRGYVTTPKVCLNYQVVGRGLEVDLDCEQPYFLRVIYDVENTNKKGGVFVQLRYSGNFVSPNPLKYRKFGFLVDEKIIGETDTNRFRYDNFHKIFSSLVKGH